ncbi:MAG TPA: VCBS repeat-containing protein [Verrucomicrobiae bacterium]
MCPQPFLNRFLLAVCSCILVGSGFAAESWKQRAGFRSLSISPAESPKPGFTLTSGQGSIAFTNALSETRHLTNQILLNGSGVAAGDINNDGLTDLYFCGLDSPNALFKNLGNWRFEEIAASSGVDCSDLLATGCALADLDGDSDLDLLVNSVGQGTHLFYNDGQGKFTKGPVLNQNLGGMSSALGDLDGDGYLDLYIANYRTLGLMDIPNARATFKTVNGKSYVETFNGRPTTSPDLTNRFSVGGGIEENGEPDLIARNQSGTNFTAIPATSFFDSAGNPLPTEFFDWGLAVAIRDINGDSLPDIYVCNDFQSEDRLWLNQGSGKFRLAPPLTQRKTSLFSMSVDFADINRDGHDDFLLADMLSREHSQRMRDLPDAPPPYNIGEFGNRPQYSINTLFLNRGDNTFSEIAQLSRIHATDWTWSCIFIDVDLDGWEDILFSNGMERAARDLDVADRMKTLRATRRMSDAEIFRARKAFPRLAPPNLAFRNKRDLTFEDASAQWNFNLAGVSHGMALADLDNDGDLDVAVNNLNAPAAIYRNDTSAPRVAVRLKGTSPNTRGIGARITVRAEGLPTQSQEMMAGGRYLSSDDPIRTFAAGSARSVEIAVRWRDGSQSRLTNLPPNHIYEIDQSSARTLANSQPQSTNAPPLFEDVSHLLNHSVPEQGYDDFARQPLLPRKLSQNGPPIAWLDWNNDGWPDLVVGAPKNGTLALFLNNRTGGFTRASEAQYNGPVKRDIVSLVPFVSEGKPMLLAALSNYEDALAYSPAVLAFSPGATSASEIAPAWEASAGPMALADIDSDGDQDLFVGGMVIPGRYPAAASSRLFKSENGKFVLYPTESALTNLALVTGAAFADLDSDKDLDLILACEWSPVRILINNNGKFVDATDRLGLNNHKGLWQGVATGDFDKDGRIDFVASNWGRNSKYQNSPSHPARLYYGDFDDDGTFDIIESHFEPSLAKDVPDRQRNVLGSSLSFINDRFRTHAAYSKASVDEILGEARNRAAVAEANHFETTVFLNRGDRFEARPLPVEAQFAPAFGVCVGDFDDDSNLDIVLAQNFFAVTPETPRHDAGRSLLLRGDGKGDFTALAGHVSGLLVYGEQRSVASADFDKDGRLDLAITQNGGEVKLFRNRTVKPEANQ